MDKSRLSLPLVGELLYSHYLHQGHHHHQPVLGSGGMGISNNSSDGGGGSGGLEALSLKSSTTTSGLAPTATAASTSSGSSSSLGGSSSGSGRGHAGGPYESSSSFLSDHQKGAFVRNNGDCSPCTPGEPLTHFHHRNESHFSAAFVCMNRMRINSQVSGNFRKKSHRRTWPLPSSAFINAEVGCRPFKSGICEKKSHCEGRRQEKRIAKLR